MLLASVEINININRQVNWLEITYAKIVKQKINQKLYLKYLNDIVSKESP